MTKHQHRYLRSYSKVTWLVQALKTVTRDRFVLSAKGLEPLLVSRDEHVCVNRP